MSVEKTELYRHFDKNKTLLYVGVSLSCAARLAQHRDHAHWFKDVDSVTIERFSTRREALEAEKIAVVYENPKCNIQLKKTIAEIARENKRLQTEQYKSDSRKDLTGRIVNFNVCYQLTEVARLFGMSSIELNRHISEGNLSFFELDAKILKGKPAKTRKQLVTGWQLISFIEYLEASGKKEKLNDSVCH
jgi:predicted GIY-YIG superfamily endonuclease